MKPGKLIWVYGLFFLFFLQLLSDFIESIYVFGLLSTGVTAEIISVILLFSPILLLAPRKFFSKTVVIILIVVMLVSRLLAGYLGPSEKMITTGIGVGCWLILFPVWLWYLSHSTVEKNSTAGTDHTHALGLGLLIGLAFSILLRLLGAGFDISTFGWTQVITWVGVALCGWMVVQYTPQDFQLPLSTQVNPLANKKPAFMRIAGLSLGICGILLCLNFAFMSPNVIARWTGIQYPLILTVLVPVLGIFAWLLCSQPQRITNLSHKSLILWNILFLLFLVLTILPHQIIFPTDLNAYPLSEPPVTILYHVPLLLMLILSPVVFLDLIYFIRELLALRPSLRQLGGGFTLAMVYLLVLLLAQVFTTVYDYIPVIGPWFRDRFWLVTLCMGLGFTLPVLLLRKTHVTSDVVAYIHPPKRWLGWVLLLCIVLTLAAAWWSVPQPPQPESARKLRILTYNIQQGYSENGGKNFAGQLDVLREVDADIIGLQESDTNRIAGGNADLVGYFARALNMYAYYGPKTVPGTFGIALLSRYPIQSAETFYMYSDREQTATIFARIAVDGRDYNIYVTHLGNGGPLVQQQNILTNVQGRENIILMGDFNFRPDSDQYNLTTSKLDDAWIVQNAPTDAGPELDPQSRIDHIFVTPGSNVVKSRYIVSPQSDHPALWAELAW